MPGSEMKRRERAGHDRGASRKLPKYWASHRRAMRVGNSRTGDNGRPLSAPLRATSASAVERSKGAPGRVAQDVAAPTPLAASKGELRVGPRKQKTPVASSDLSPVVPVPFLPASFATTLPGSSSNRGADANTRHVGGPKPTCVSCEAQSKKAADWLDRHVLGLTVPASSVQVASPPTPATLTQAHPFDNSMASLVSSPPPPPPPSSSSRTTEAARRRARSSSRTTTSRATTPTTAPAKMYETGRSLPSVAHFVSSVSPKSGGDSMEVRPSSLSPSSAVLRMPAAGKLARLLTRNAMSALRDTNKRHLLAQLRSHRAQPPGTFKELRKAFVQAEVASAFCYTTSHAQRAAFKRCERFSYLCGKLNDALRQENDAEAARRALQAAAAFEALRPNDLGAPSLASRPVSPTATPVGAAPQDATKNTVSSDVLLRRLQKSRRNIVGIVRSSTGDGAAPALTNDVFNRLRRQLRKHAYVHRALRGDGDGQLHNYWHTQLQSVTDRMGLVHDQLVDGTRRICQLTPRMIHVIKAYAKVPLGAE